MKYRMILCAIFIGITGHVCACKCAGPGTVKEEFAVRELVIFGKVISKRLVTPAATIREDKVNEVRKKLVDDKQKYNFFDTEYIFEVKIEVIEKFKGGSRDTVTIYTAMNSASCGNAFEKDKVYIIYASKRSYMDMTFLPESERDKGIEKENTYWTTNCSRTAEYRKQEADELRALKE